MTTIQNDQQTQLVLENVAIDDERLLVVNLALNNLEDLYGVQVQLRYDPAQLKVRDDNRRLEGIQISPGPLIAGDDRFVVTNRVDSEAGVIHFAFTLLKPAPPISEDGVLATAVFEIIGNAPFAVTIDNAALVSSGLQPILVSTQDLYLNGALEPVPESVATTPNLSLSLRTWGLPLAGLLILGAAAILIFFGLRTRREPAAGKGQEPDRQIPRGSHATLRSAALLAEQGTHALEQGDMQRAYELFSRAIELDPANTQAWLGKGLMAEQSTEKRICLQRVLALDPNNAAARQALARLKEAGFRGQHE